MAGSVGAAVVQLPSAFDFLHTRYPDVAFYAALTQATDFVAQSPWLFGLSVAAASGAAQAPWFRFCCYLQDRKWGPRAAHADQAAVRAECAVPDGTVARHAKLLRMPPGEIAQRSGLPVGALRYYVRHPNVVPRPDYWARLEEALMLPMGFFVHGREYDPESAAHRRSTANRLRRYYEQRVSFAWTHQRIDEADHASRTEVLRTLEAQIEGRVREGLVP